MSEEYSEREIRKTLRKVAKQRVVMKLGDGGVWIVENTVKKEDKRAQAILSTCYMRGWIEIGRRTVPIEAVEGEGEDRHLPHDLSNLPQTYRLTTAGWSAIEHTHAWVLATCFVASAALLATIVSIAARWW